MYLPYFGQNLDSKKKTVGILAYVWLRARRSFGVAVGGTTHSGLPPDRDMPGETRVRRLRATGSAPSLSRDYRLVPIAIAIGAKHWGLQSLAIAGPFGLNI